MSSTSEQRLSKRKQPPNPSNERPMKQFKHQDVSGYSNGNDGSFGNSGSPELARGNSNASEMPLDVEERGALSRVPTAATDTPEWQAMVEKVIKNVVSIHFCQTHSFDTDGAIASEATGFVVDAEKGYILTNRHVVGAGPFWGYCIFDNHEECDVHPVYRDPVHDFGILRFDPKKIKYMPVTALKLRPDLAKVGSEIRVVGNDAGEKLSILSGVISRLDRNAPEYGDGYCDFNTNYIQAAASASGGSSGSPVVNQEGHAVALQAGGRSDGAATDYFLPLDRPLRALQLIQAGKSVSRGTIQTQWLLKPYDECRRLGLTANWEAEMRAQFPNETGVLVAEVVLPQGPAHEKLEEGDVLLKVNGQLVSQFIRLDEILDSSVEKKVTLMIQRGGEDMEVEIEVGDLHAITPDRFVQVAGATFHDLSYQQARLYAISIKGNGVYVCETGGTFRLEGSESGWMIQSVNNQDTPDLDAFIKVMAAIPDRSRVVIAYKHLRDLHTRNTAIINVDRHWHKKMRLAVRNDKTGLWDFSDLADALPAETRSPQRAKFISMQNEKHPQVVEVIKSFVRVTCLLPVKLDGFPRGRKTGHGLVVDAEKGLVVISRAIVPYDMCDIHITIADSIQVPGKVLFMHPLQNFAVIQYDAKLVQADVQSAKLSKQYVKQGQDIVFFGFNQNYRPVTVQTTITDITTVAIPATSVTPRYRAVNIDAITVDTNLAAQCGSGVLMSEDGTVQALWMTYLGDRSGHSGKDVEYHLGLQTPMIQPVIDQIQAGVIPDLRMLNVELHTCPMDHARILGVPEGMSTPLDGHLYELLMTRRMDHSGRTRRSRTPPALHGPQSRQRPQRRRSPGNRRAPHAQRQAHHARLRPRHSVQQRNTRCSHRTQARNHGHQGHHHSHIQHRDIARSCLLRSAPASPTPRSAPADLQGPQRRLHLRSHTRLTRLHVRPGTHKLHHAPQRHANARPADVPARSREDPGQHVFQAEGHDVRQCAVGRDAQVEQALLPHGGDGEG